MQTGSVFPAAFFARPSPEVAPELIGAYVLHHLEGATLVGRIVEVEAYLGDGSDPASHTHRGLTPRNRAMFGPPGRLYVYLSYGIHICANVVCEPEGAGAAVLFRAIEPVAGVERMRELRGLPPESPLPQIGSGPGRLTQALGIAMDDYGRSLLSGRLCLRRPAGRDPALRVVSAPRVGVSQARLLR